MTAAKILAFGARALLCALMGVAPVLAYAATRVVNSATDDPGDGSTTGASAKVTNVDPARWSGPDAGTITLHNCIVAASLMTGATGVPTDPGMVITFDGSVFTDSAHSTIALASELPLIFNNTTIDAAALPVQVTIDGGNGSDPGNGHRGFFVSGLPEIPPTGIPSPDGAQPITFLLRNLKIQYALAKGGSSYYGGGGMGAGGGLFVNQLATVERKTSRSSATTPRAAAAGSAAATVR
jgi:hypothetical protein